jgi:DNA invertase Pin-like site-specific DNA recombinase
VFREKITGTTADRPQLKKLMAALTHGDVVIITAVDRLSADTTDLMVIARDMQRSGAGLRSGQSRCLIPRATSRNLCLPCLAWPRSWNAAASPSEQHGAAQTPRRRA